MKPRTILAILLLTITQACNSGGGKKGTDSPGIADFDDAKTIRHKSPDGSFAINIPEGWKLDRQQKVGSWLTLISSSEEAWLTIINSENHKAAELKIYVFKQQPMGNVPADIKDRFLLGLAEPFFNGWLAGLKEQARVERASKAYRTKIDGSDAIRMDVGYYRGDGHDPRSGYVATVLGEHTGFYISLVGDEAGVRALERIMLSFKIEPDK